MLHLTVSLLAIDITTERKCFQLDTQNYLPYTVITYYRLKRKHLISITGRLLIIRRICLRDTFRIRISGMRINCIPSENNYRFAQIMLFYTRKTKFIAEQTLKS